MEEVIVRVQEKIEENKKGKVVDFWRQKIVKMIMIMILPRESEASRTEDCP